MMIDFHSHILPGLDHGSSSVETSLEQLRLASTHGVDKVVATSHFYPHRENVDRFVARRKHSVDKLTKCLTPDLPEIKIGAEVLICDNIEDIPMLDELCISGTRILLLELPFTDFSRGYLDSVSTLIAKGYTVVLAHADRYNPANIEQLLDVGAMIQLNADSLDRVFVKRHIRDWIKRGKVCARGSDIHGPDQRAYKRFTAAYKRLGDQTDIISAASDKMWRMFK